MPKSWITLIYIFLSVWNIHNVCANTAWMPIAPGLDYLDLNTQSITRWSHIHVFRIDLDHFQLRFASATDRGKSSTTVRDLALHHQVPIAINGGFFDTNDQPLGLRIQDHQMTNPLKKISWWGVFSITHDHARLQRFKEFTPNPNITWAIQAGPRLIANGKKITLKNDLAERTAIGIDASGHIILLVTEHSPMTTSKLASLLQSAPMLCKDALNLDGGRSSQLFVNLDTLHIDVPGFATIRDAIIVQAKDRG